MRRDFWWERQGLLFETKQKFSLGRVWICELGGSPPPHRRPPGSSWGLIFPTHPSTVGGYCLVSEILPVGMDYSWDSVKWSWHQSVF